MSSSIKRFNLKGFKCLKCFSNVYVEYYTSSQCNGSVSNDSDDLKRTDVCKCGNIALILDLDGIVHMYCDDIKSVLLCQIDTVVPDEAKVLLSSASWYYQDYSLSHKPLEFIPNAKKRKHIEHYNPKNKFKNAFKRRDNEKSKTRD